MTPVIHTKLDRELNSDEFNKVLKAYLIEYVDTISNKSNLLDSKSVSNEIPNKENYVKNESTVEKIMNIENHDIIYKEIINDLLRQTLLSGVHINHEVKSTSSSASEGYTAALVNFTSTDIKFVTKIDDDEKLLREATILKIIENRIDLPTNFSNYFPKVYGIKKDKPPYAYIMEAFNRKSLSKLLYEDKIEFVDSKTIIIKILEILFNAYQFSINMTVMPNITGLYLDRIKKGIQVARDLDRGFSDFSNKNLIINGKLYQPLEDYLEKIESNIKKFQVNFTTFIHGDSYPENILVELDEKKADIKFIDPKGCFEGDYMFDIGKLCHYLLVSGQLLKSEQKIIAQIDIMKNIINYNLEKQNHIIQLIDIIKENVRKFSIVNNDTNWEDRYILSIASNLLTIPAILLKEGEDNSAFIIYAEGLKYLSICTN